ACTRPKKKGRGRSPSPEGFSVQVQRLRAGCSDLCIAPAVSVLAPPTFGAVRDPNLVAELDHRRPDQPVEQLSGSAGGGVVDERGRVRVVSDTRGAASGEGAVSVAP